MSQTPHHPHHNPAPHENPPLPNDLTAGWLPEDTRQTPTSPLPAPKLFGFQSLLPFTFLNSIRHPAEMPLVAMAYALTLLIYIGGAVYMITGIASLFTNPENTWLLPRSLLSQLLALALYLPLIFFILRAIMYAEQRIQGVRISPTQFPEAYQMVAEAAHAAGLRRVPDAYVVAGNGTINAFASGHGHRRYIVIYSDLFEIGGAARNPEALRFIIGHEVGHIAAGHVSYFRLIFTSFFTQIPILGKLLSRTQEYTADNFGYRFCPQGAESVTSVLAAGKYLMNDVNFHELANRAVYERGFFTWVANLTTTHPPITWRAHALRDRTEPGRLVWRPKNNPAYPLSMIPAAEPAEVWSDPLQATDFMATYPEKPGNTHWGTVQTEPREAAQHRDRTIGDMLHTGWIPPHYRQQTPAPQGYGQGSYGVAPQTAATQHNTTPDTGTDTGYGITPNPTRDTAPGTTGNDGGTNDSSSDGGANN